MIKTKNPLITVQYTNETKCPSIEHFMYTTSGIDSFEKFLEKNRYIQNIWVDGLLVYHYSLSLKIGTMYTNNVFSYPFVYKLISDYLFNFWHFYKVKEGWE